MSTILKAAQELDREGGLVTPPLAAPEPAPKPQALRIAVLLLGLAAAGLSLTLVLVLSGRPAEKPRNGGAEEPPRGAEEQRIPRHDVVDTEPVSGAAPPKSAGHDVAAVPRAPAPPPPHGSEAVTKDTESRGKGADVQTTRRRDIAAPRPRAAAPVRSSEDRSGEDEPRHRDTAAAKNRDSDFVALPRASAPAPPRSVASAAVSVAGEPGLQVKSLAYSTDVRERSVALQLAGGRGVNLHEGESAGGVEVQLILPNVVYLRKGGNIIAVTMPSGGRE